MKPHRGVVILILGILALVTGLGFVLGPIAWIMGNNDLREIRAGIMDPEGESTTNVGRILGIIATILSVLMLVLFCLVFVLGFMMFSVQPSPTGPQALP